MLIELSHEEERAVRYVDRARLSAKDKSHPVLQAVNVNGGIEAADGFRLHAANIQLDEPGLWSYGKPGPVLQVDAQDGAFPDCSRIVPKEEPAMVVVLNSKFLRDALAGLSEYVTLRLYSPTKPVEVMGTAAVKRGKTPPEVYALIMPCHTRNHAEIISTWRPHQDAPEDAPEDAGTD